METAKIITRPIRNVNPCPHIGKYSKIIKTSGGRHAVICDVCYAEMLDRLSDSYTVHEMMSSYMTLAEVEKMRNERRNMAVEQGISAAVIAAHITAGYPQHLALPLPVAAL